MSRYILCRCVQRFSQRTRETSEEAEDSRLSKFVEEKKKLFNLSRLEVTQQRMANLLMNPEIVFEVNDTKSPRKQHSAWSPITRTEFQFHLLDHTIIHTFMTSSRKLTWVTESFFIFKTFSKPYTFVNVVNFCTHLRTRIQTLIQQSAISWNMASSRAQRATENWGAVMLVGSVRIRDLYTWGDDGLPALIGSYFAISTLASVTFCKKCDTLCSHILRYFAQIKRRTQPFLDCLR